MRGEEFQRAEAANRLIRIPTGDGMVLVFYTSPEAPNIPGLYRNTVSGRYYGFKRYAGGGENARYAQPIARLQSDDTAHPCAFHIRRASPPAEKLQDNQRAGPVMGIFPSARYQTATRSMTKGDLIMLFTDGLFEVKDGNGKMFSLQQLHATVNRHAALPPEEFFTRVLEEIRSFSKREVFNDDVCVVGVEVRRTIRTPNDES